MIDETAFLDEYDRHVVTSFGKPFPLIVVQAEDVYLTDLKGRKYLDFWAGIATVNAGHGNPMIQGAVKDQLERLVHCSAHSFYTLPALDLATKLADIAPIQPCKSSFHTSGSEASDVAIKMVRRYTGKHEVLTLQGSYHGQTYGARSLGTPVATYSKAFAMGPFLPGVIHVPTPYCYRCSLGHTYPSCRLQCAKMIEDIIAFSTSHDVAAYMAEPILGVGGIVTPPLDYFSEVHKILHKYDILLVLDEVQTGLGRTGALWGSQIYNVQPDVMILAKALGNGWPISAVVASPPIGDALEVGDHFSTWGANPVMCAAASATIEFIVENKLWENAKKMGGLLRQRLTEVAEASGIVGEVRGRGLMIGVELVKDITSKAPGAEECKAIRNACLEEGLIVGVGGFWSNVIRIQPPLTINEEHVAQGMDAFEKAVKTVENQR
jgi:4-aminobutyrate aminotransferase-like enzyme